MTDKKLILKDLEDIQRVFDQHGVKFVMTYGALLGWYRDKDFLPGDDDIDVSVIDEVDFKTKKSIGWMLYDLGFLPQSITINVFGRMEPVEIGYNGDEKSGIIVCERNFKFTIFFFKKEMCEMHGEEYVDQPRQGSVKLISTPTKFFKKLGKIKVEKKYYPAPTPIKEYLEFTYGDWKNPLDRRHADTYFVHHEGQNEFINLEGKNEVKYN